MSAWFLLAGALAVVNAPRIRPALPEAGDRRIAVTAAGATLVFVLGASATLWAEAGLEALDISPETWRIATGAIAVVAGVWVLGLPLQREEKGLEGPAAALAPVAFPLILTPELAAFLVLFGATEPAATWLPVLAVALLTVAAAAVPSVVRRGLWAGTSRLMGGLLIVVAIAQIVEGIRDV